MTAHAALYLSMANPAGGRRSVDLTGLGSAFGQDHGSS
jgi:hypothetical protein